MTTRAKIFVLSAPFLIFLTGCDRMKMSGNRLAFKAPDQAALGLPEIGADKKFCFGVNVTAADIVGRAASACAPKWGQATEQLVDSGQDIVTSATSGKGRDIELYAYLTDASGACPSGSEAWAASAAALGRLYKVGVVTGVEISGEETVVSMPINSVKLNRPVMATNNLPACERPQGAGVISQLTTAGEVLTATNESRIGSFLTAIWESVFQWNPFSTGGDGVGGSTSHGELAGDVGSGLQFPTYLRSVARKPDSRDYFALMGEGQIVRVTANGEVVPLTADSCPFAADVCKVPDWVMSISPGYGDQLYVVDHAGQVYKQEADQTLTPTVTQVSPTVTHVVYY